MSPRLLLRLPVLLLALLAASPAIGQAAPVADSPPPGAVSTTLDPVTTTVGGRVTATIDLIWTGDQPLGPPRFLQAEGVAPAAAGSPRDRQDRPTWGEAEILEAEPIERTATGWRQRLVLSSFTVGAVDLPPAVAVVPLAEEQVRITAAETEAFLVESVLTAATPAADPLDPVAATPPPTDPLAEPNATPEPRPLAPPIALDTGASARFAWAAGLATLLLALALWRTVRAIAEQPLPAAIDPLSLLAPLDELSHRLESASVDDPVAAHVGLSLALRIYLARRLGISARERTTTEIRRSLRTAALGAGSLPADAERRVVDLLRAADRVKFAREATPAEVTVRRLDEARTVAAAIDAHVALREASRAEAERRGEARSGEIGTGQIAAARDRGRDAA